MIDEKHVVILRDREGAGGGIFNYYRAVAQYLKFDVDFVDVGRSYEFYSNGVKGARNRLPTPVRLLADWAKLAVRLFRLPDLVHVNSCMDIPHLRSLRRDAVNVLIAKVFRRQVLVFWRGWDNRVCGTLEFPGGNSGWMSRAYRLADAHIVLASDFRNDLRRWGFDTPIYLETTVASDTVVEGYVEKNNSRIDSGVFNILFLSRVEVNKGVFEMLDGFGLLESRNPGRYRLTVAGDGPALAEVKTKSDEMGLDNICFVGYVGGKEKVECYNAADAFCFLSYSEGMPNAVLEAMAMGLPLVSSDAGGLKDILIDGETGYILLPNQGKPPRYRFLPSDIAERFETLADSSDLCRMIGSHNRKLADERFAADKVGTRLSKIYREMIGIDI
jgi:glycosyltransferase involved in cell wall biosynthesis